MPSAIWTTSDSPRLTRVFGAGRKIVEATMPLSFVLLPKFLKGAQDGSAVCCAIAKALNTSVAILKTTAYIEHGGNVVKYKNSDDALAFIRMFDGTKNRMTLTGPMPLTFLPLPKSHTKAECRKRHKALVKRIKSGKPAHKYSKPTAAKGSKVLVYTPQTHNFVVTERDPRCDARWQSM